ncbi:hypothetical protein PPACK8108_LOCUS14268 [Phakopsora pachyrhizi]|uniref:Uncharacterized protein n=1 Tax=Phakopsora pachyrhizi TaxID=170000 RepID=A0AAV0B5X6_PHAPC|nr:hypothetical protein PPACK8108_LOCUS14268 [Phakopsora pachyrhizi]
MVQRMSMVSSREKRLLKITEVGFNQQITSSLERQKERADISKEKEKQSHGNASENGQGYLILRPLVFLRIATDWVTCGYL